MVTGHRNEPEPQGGPMQSVDNSQFSEEQRAEAYRVESMRQLMQQTKELRTIRGIAVVFLVLAALGVVLWLVALISAGQL